jgi:hypothetical protein
VQPASWTGAALGLHQCKILGYLKSSPVQKSLQSRVRGRVRFAEQAVHEDELTLSPPNSLDGLLGNAAGTIQQGYRPGLRRITCGSIASSVWSRRQKWW